MIYFRHELLVNLSDDTWDVNWYKRKVHESHHYFSKNKLTQQNDTSNHQRNVPRAKSNKSFTLENSTHEKRQIYKFSGKSLCTRVQAFAHMSRIIGAGLFTRLTFRSRLRTFLFEKTRGKKEKDHRRLRKNDGQEPRRSWPSISIKSEIYVRVETHRESGRFNIPRGA